MTLDNRQGLAVLVVRLYRRLEKLSPNDPIIAQAKEYLQRLGLPETSILRDEKQP